MNNSQFVTGKVFSKKIENTNGSLDGLTFAVKDLYSVAGYVTGAGNIRWEETHARANSNATVVDELLNQGAELVGKTITDELAFSLDGENVHYGTAINPSCNERIPGGSSSGSASVVASGLVDFALGTDTAGSVRVPASYCGTYGIRTSSNLISTDGIHPLSQTYDTVGWFTRDIKTLKQVGDTLIPTNTPKLKIERIFIVEDILNLLDSKTRNTFLQIFNKISKLNNIKLEIINVFEKHGINVWLDTFKNIQWSELNRNHGDWARKNIDSFGEEIKGRIELIDSISVNEEIRSREIRNNLIDYINNILGSNCIFLLPTVHDIAPLKNREISEARSFRGEAIKCNLISSVTGVPQITMPLVKKDNCPIGLSIIGPKNTDLSLIDLCQVIIEQLSREEN